MLRVLFFLVLCCCGVSSSLGRSLTFTAGETAVAKGGGIEYAQRSGQVEWAAFAILNGNINEGKCLVSANPFSWCSVALGPIVGAEYEDVMGARMYGGVKAKIVPRFGRHHFLLKGATRYRGSVRLHHLVIARWLYDWTSQVSAGPMYQPIKRSDHALPWDHRVGVHASYTRRPFTVVTELRMSTGSPESSFGTYHRVGGHIELVFNF